MQYICKIDKRKLGDYKDKITTEKVVLTNERLKHIKERHPGDYENYSKFLIKVIKKPDYILEDTKNIDTVILLKRLKYKRKNIQLIMKLSTGRDTRRNKNSILTFWKVRNSTYLQLIRNKRILYKKE